MMHYSASSAAFALHDELCRRRPLPHTQRPPSPHTGMKYDHSKCCPTRNLYSQARRPGRPNDVPLQVFLPPCVPCLQTCERRSHAFASKVGGHLPKLSARHSARTARTTALPCAQPANYGVLQRARRHRQNTWPVDQGHVGPANGWSQTLCAQHAWAGAPQRAASAQPASLAPRLTAPFCGSAAAASARRPAPAASWRACTAQSRTR